ncbi:MAG: hypothetical protein LIO94_04790 [Clostridiales bacterium]|nr:hypothetical protein [Clostridiales bacterium]
MSTGEIAVAVFGLITLAVTGIAALFFHEWSMWVDDIFGSYEDGWEDGDWKQD